MNLNQDSATRVLLIEDNPIDIRLMRYAFERDRDWRTVMTVAEDGEKAINLLSQSLGGDQKHDFVILDLNLPKRDGTEVLHWIRNTEGLRDLPVAVVSSSPLDVIQSKLRGASLHANGYFVKPMEVDIFLQLTRDLHLCYQSAMFQM